MAIEIVDFPMKNGGSFQFAMLVITRGYIGLSWAENRNPKGRFDRPSSCWCWAHGSPCSRDLASRPLVEAFWLYKSLSGRWLMTIPDHPPIIIQLWETNPWFLTAGFSALWWALCGAFGLCQRLLWKNVWRCDNKIYQYLSISITVDDGGHIGRDMSLTLFSSTIACLETHANRHVGPVGPKFRDAKEAPKEREKWSPTTLMIQASLFSPHDTWLIYCSISFIFLVTCLSCHVVFLHFLGSSSDSAPGASCDRSKLSSSKVPPQIWAKGVSLAKGKSAGKPWIYQPNNNAK